MAMRKDDTDVRPIRDLLRRLIAAPSAWSFLWPLLLIIIGYVSYSRWGSDHLNSKFESIDQSKITISPPHQYVRTDVVDEVYRFMALKDVSLLDPKATARIAAAFARNPWVREVDSVQKLPHGAVDVKLQYRVPVAVFRLTSAKREINGDHFFALDGEGVLLPNEKLTLQDVDDFIQIEVLEAKPQGGKGFRFGEQRVEKAAGLAMLLSRIRNDVHITKITAVGDSRTNIVPQLEITIGNDVRLFWGSPPGLEQPGERDAKSKVADLLNGNFRRGDNLSVAKQSEKVF